MASTPLPDTEYVSVREAAAYLDIDPHQLRMMHSKGTAPEAISDGYRLWFKRSDIEQMTIRKRGLLVRRPHTKVIFSHA